MHSVTSFGVIFCSSNNELIQILYQKWVAAVKKIPKNVEVILKWEVHRGWKNFKAHDRKSLDCL